MKSRAARRVNGAAGPTESNKVPAMTANTTVPTSPEKSLVLIMIALTLFGRFLYRVLSIPISMSSETIIRIEVTTLTVVELGSVKYWN